MDDMYTAIIGRFLPNGSVNVKRNDRMIAVFCKKCNKKLYYLSDIKKDRQSTCPNCNSISKIYYIRIKRNS